MWTGMNVRKKRERQRQRTKDMSPGKTLFLLALSTMTAKRLVYFFMTKNYLMCHKRTFIISLGDPFSRLSQRWITRTDPMIQTHINCYGDWIKVINCSIVSLQSRPTYAKVTCFKVRSSLQIQGKANGHYLSAAHSIPNNFYGNGT
jgi:hypothetical protein